MPDDEPLDDARAVATAAAAAAARITETVARHVSDTKARERAVLERAQTQQVARQTLGTAGQKVVSQRVDQGYDSTEQRGGRDAVREEAGVSLESRRVVAVADQMNGQAPTLAAAAGQAQKTQTRTGSLVRDRTRGR